MYVCFQILEKSNHSSLFFLMVRVSVHFLFIHLFLFIYLFYLHHTKSDILNQNDISPTFMKVYFLIILSFGKIWHCSFLCLYSIWVGGWHPGRFIFFFSVKQHCCLTSVFSKSKEMSACGSREKEFRELFLLINPQMTFTVYFEEMGQIGEMSFSLFIFCSL